MNFLNVHNYTRDGFVKIATVEHDRNHYGYWRFNILNEDLFFENHRSWAYIIASGNEVVKLGETGNPLGIRSTRGKHKGQPITGTKSRMGRLRMMGDVDAPNGDTDARIRSELREDVSAGKVSVWVRRCDIDYTETKIHGETITIPCLHHKDIERKYLNRIVEETGRLPRLNPAKI
jgi:hypothetical protein